MATSDRVHSSPSVERQITAMATGCGCNPSRGSGRSVGTTQAWPQATIDEP
jgi:hypothetical protein